MSLMRKKATAKQVKTLATAAKAVAALPLYNYHKFGLDALEAQTSLLQLVGDLSGPRHQANTAKKIRDLGTLVARFLEDFTGVHAENKYGGARKVLTSLTASYIEKACSTKWNAVHAEKLRRGYYHNVPPDQYQMKRFESLQHE